MAYRECQAPELMRGLVECGWTAWLTPRESPQVHDVLPDGCMDLVWTGTELLVAGPDTGPHPVRRDPGVASAGLRFAPGQLSALLAVPAAALRDQRVPLGDLHRDVARRAIHRLELGAAPSAVLADLACALPGPAAAVAVRAVAGRLGAGVSAAATADALGWTTRSLHRRCVAAFGYGPTVLRRVLRFRRAVALLHTGIPLAEVAARAGYADQPHLSREVRAWAGVSARQVASAANRSTVLPSGS